uniref:Uncharacterized protein n=1 Tax=Oryza rufipogon TaxID=4529 RepID=A0A0E0R5X7_ORYRU
METPSAPAPGDGNSAPASSRVTFEDMLRSCDQSYYQMLGFPDAASYFEAKERVIMVVPRATYVASVNHEEILEHVSSILNSKGIIPSKRPSKLLVLKEARDKFFPYWKSVLSARLPVKIVPPCEPSSNDIQRTEPRKDILSTEASRKDLQPPNKSIANLVSTSKPRLASNYECRRQLCALAAMSLKVLRRTLGKDESIGGMRVAVLESVFVFF